MDASPPKTSRRQWMGFAALIAVVVAVLVGTVAIVVVVLATCGCTTV